MGDSASGHGSVLTGSGAPPQARSVAEFPSRPIGSELLLVERSSAVAFRLCMTQLLPDSAPEYCDNLSLAHIFGMGSGDSRNESAPLVRRGSEVAAG